MAAKKSDQSKGGVARAEKLSAAERSEIARRGAEARWAPQIATHDGEIEISGISIPCAVLEDGTRLIAQRGLYRAMGRSESTGGLRSQSAQQLPRFLAPKNLEPFVSEELRRASVPIRFRARDGKSAALGYDANLLPGICEVFLAARDAGALAPAQARIAEQCEILVRGLAQVGIVALVDEATGYQNVRARDALEQILERYISDHLLTWAKRFPDEFYRQIFRLKGWDYAKLAAGKKPPLIGKYTNDLVYQRIAPGVIEELHRLNPPRPGKGRRWKHHQWLTEDVGHPALRDHLMGVIALMKATPDGQWKDFKRMLTRVYPKCNEQIELHI